MATTETTLDPFSPITVSDHAVGRYRSRLCPSVHRPRDEIEAELAATARASLLLDRFTRGRMPPWLKRDNKPRPPRAGDEAVWVWPEDCRYAVLLIPIRHGTAIFIKTVVTPE